MAVDLDRIADAGGDLVTPERLRREAARRRLFAEKLLTNARTAQRTVNGLD